MEQDPDLTRLARLAATGDRAALRGIYQRCATRLFGEVLAPILRSRAACEDALKETFVAVLEKPSRLAEGEVFPFLATIARNKALDRLRRMATEGRFAAALGAELERGAERTDPEGQAQQAEAWSRMHERVERVLSGMNPRYGKALRLRLLEERSRAECAEALGTTIGAFDVLFFRACKQFRVSYVETYGKKAGGTT